MYGIYLTVVKHKDHFAFAFAIILSTFILLNNESPKMSIIRGKATDVVSFFSSPFAWIQSLMFLEKENQVLREKNLELSLQVESMLNLQNENNALMEMLEFKNNKKFIIKSAKVVNKGIQPNLLSIIIDRGTFDGVKNNLPVLTPKGVVGKTIEASKNNSIVQLISDANFRLSTRILPSGATGILRFVNGETAEIREVQKNVVINIGDKVVTSGFSDIYPAGLPVGTVKGVYQDRSSFQKVVSIYLPNDLNAFQHVFIVKKNK
jgi:rod shape-determining protein MreC